MSTKMNWKAACETIFTKVNKELVYKEAREFCIEQLQTMTRGNGKAISREEASACFNMHMKPKFEALTVTPLVAAPDTAAGDAAGNNEGGDTAPEAPVDGNNEGGGDAAPAAAAPTETVVGIKAKRVMANGHEEEFVFENVKAMKAANKGVAAADAWRAVQ